ncbi:MAG: formate dehydrogenase subunit alpha [Acidobacteriia bacterium]|nr:formate dehydrogenase subunit alpha [Terriglobia bacterium]
MSLPEETVLRRNWRLPSAERVRSASVSWKRQQCAWKEAGVRVTINGTPAELAAGLTVLEAVDKVGIRLPALCHDPRVKPSGNCRLCLVEIVGHEQPVASCHTGLSEGMQIRTHTPELEAGRKAILELLARRYPADALRRWPDNPFHQWLRHYGLGGGTPERTAAIDDSHPYIQVDMMRCIYCDRCVRICAELQGQFVWSMRNRGEETAIVADAGVPLGQSSCVSCGACADTCPTGALADRQVIDGKPATSWVRTVCPYCGTGCEMSAGAADGRLTAIKPVMDVPVSRGHLCVKGRYAFDFVHARDRVTQPRLRKDGQWTTVSWDQAMNYTAAALLRIRERYGPDAIGVLGSARATNEENYLAQKFARVVLGTNNVDCCARVCHAPSAAAMGGVLGTGAATNSYDDIEAARTILVFGANPTENHPILGARIKQAALNGARLIVADPRRIELADYSNIHLPVCPGTNVALLNAMACTIVEEGLFDAEFISARASDWEQFRTFIREWPPERMAGHCGVAAGLIREAARLYATAKPSMIIHGLGVTEQAQGTEGVICLVNLALLTGNFGKPGTGVNPLRGQNNVQGSAHMGCEPEHLPGYADISTSRERFEQAWGAPLPATRGKNLLEMMDAAERGELRALWAIGYDVLLTNPNTAATLRALSNLELVIVQDMFWNETANQFGTVFLPAASSFEKDGTFMNAERRVQRVRKVIEPVGGSHPDWEIVCALARAMGHERGFSFQSPEQIWNEVRSVWNAGAGISYARLDEQGLQWPCPSEASPGTTILHVDQFSCGPRAALRRIPWKPTAETTSPDFPILLVTGRTLYQFNAGTMTMRTPNVFWRPQDTLDLVRDDADRYGVREGERVRVLSRYGQTELPVRITEGLPRGQAFATFHSAGTAVNAVTGPSRDPQTCTPEYKVTAIRIEKLPA